MSISTDQVIEKLEAELAGLKMASSDKARTKHLSKIQVLAELWLDEETALQPEGQENKAKVAPKQVFPTPLNQSTPPIDVKEERGDGTSIFDF